MGRCYAKLLHFFELVDAEDASSVTAVGARLLQRWASRVMVSKSRDKGREEKRRRKSIRGGNIG